MVRRIQNKNVHAFIKVKKLPWWPIASIKWQRQWVKKKSPFRTAPREKQCSLIIMICSCLHWEKKKKRFSKSFGFIKKCAPTELTIWTIMIQTPVTGHRVWMGWSSDMYANCTQTCDCFYESQCWNSIQKYWQERHLKRLQPHTANKALNQQWCPGGCTSSCCSVWVSRPQAAAQGCWTQSPFRNTSLWAETQKYHKSHSVIGCCLGMPDPVQFWTLFVDNGQFSSQLSNTTAMFIM